MHRNPGNLGVVERALCPDHCSLTNTGMLDRPGHIQSHQYVSRPAGGEPAATPEGTPRLPANLPIQIGDLSNR